MSKTYQNLEEGCRQDVLVFFKMCGERDRKFLSLPQKKCDTEDYVRLLSIAVALTLRGPIFLILSAAGNRIDEVMRRLEEVKCDFSLISAWMEEFIAAIRDPIFKETARRTWDDKCKRDCRPFELGKLF